jgi:integrase/recombinase XerD
MFFRYFKKKQGPGRKKLLREKFKNFVLELKVRGFSEKTIDIYLYYNGRFLDFIKKEPRSVTSMDIKSYLNYLVLEGLEPRTVNMALNSLKAYYEGFMGKKLFKSIKRSKIPKNLPNVLSKDEIRKMIDKTKSLKHKLLIELLYSSGMRIGECVKIKVEDINTAEKLIFIKEGKGKKDRYTITSGKFIDDLKKYLSQRKKQSIYIFDNGYGSHASIRTAEEIVKLAAKRAGIKKTVYPHLLRASFATHLIEDEVGIEKIQKLLGHSRINTTLGYLRTKTDDLKNIKSPLD